jgi:hypothetical protein
MCLSGGISLLGYSRYNEFQMDDYSFASEIKLVPTLYLSASYVEYYDWEVAMDEFLWGRGLEYRVIIFFAKRTFSMHVLQWWINLQQQHIASWDKKEIGSI